MTPREEHAQREAARRKAAEKEQAKQGLALPQVIIVPVTDRRLTELPASRRQEFSEHLDELLADVKASEHRGTPAAAPAGAPSQVVQDACALCRGHCCTLGGTHAFLDSEHLWKSGKKGAAAIKELYLSYLGSPTYEGACVYQGRTGCALPYALRSDLCNKFLCGGLEHHTDEPAFIAATTFDANVIRTTAPGDGIVDSTPSPQARGRTPRPG